MIKNKRLRLLFICLVLIAVAGCQRRSNLRRSADAVLPHPILKPLPPNALPQLKQLNDGAVAQAGVTTGYDPSYVKIDYPAGDVASFLLLGNGLSETS